MTDENNSVPKAPVPRSRFIEMSNGNIALASGVRNAYRNGLMVIVKSHGDETLLFSEFDTEDDAQAELMHVTAQVKAYEGTTFARRNTTAKRRR